MLSHTQPKGLTPVKYILYGAFTLLLTAQAYAEPVYRCGDAYSPLAQCASGTAAVVKPSNELQHNSSGSQQAAARDLQDAQALEKQRRLAERQALQNGPVHMGVLTAPAAPASHTVTTPPQGKYARRVPSPYFTAADPASRPQKKSTVKAVPANTP
jgi:hypothetical protein